MNVESRAITGLVMMVTLNVAASLTHLPRRGVQTAAGVAVAAAAQTAFVCRRHLRRAADEIAGAPEVRRS